MHWTTVPFGKYRGKTLPEILVRDGAGSFDVLPKLYGKLAQEAQELARRTRATKERCEEFFSNDANFIDV